MSSLTFYRFYFLRVYKDYPKQLAAVLVSVAILVLGLCLTLGVRERSTLLSHEKARLSATRMSVLPVSETKSSLALPPLRAGELVKTFNAIARDSSVPIDEVAYSLDDIATTPYLRYRITLSTKTGYGQIRKFVAILSAEMPNVGLDTVRCTRADAAALDLGCELVFSAFFSRTDRG